MRAAVIKGSALAALSALVWATYYVFVPWIDALSPLSLFFYPSLFGALLFLVYGFYTTGRIPHPARARDYFIPGAGYFASQMLIILSTVSNGGVLTSTFILLGDTIISPSIIFLLGLNRFKPRLPLLALGMAVLVLSAAFLTTYGGFTAAKSAEGLILLVLIPPSLSLFFVYTNERIMAEGMAQILMPAFLVSSLFVAGYAAVVRQSYPLEFNGVRDLLVLATIGVTSMFAGYMLFFAASRMTGFTLSSILMALIPPFTLILGVLFLGLRANAWIIALIILAALGAGLCTVAFAEGGVLNRRTY